jgi:Mg-chelatase subunit ChlD
MTESRWTFLDRLPERLFRPTVANAHGSLVRRGHAMVALRDRLLEGALPSSNELAWPENQTMRSELLDALRAANVAPFCRADADLSDDVTLFVLDVVSEAHDFYQRALLAGGELARRGEHRLVSCDADPATCEDGAPERSAGPLSDEAWAQAHGEATRLTTILLRTRCLDAWLERMRAMARIGCVFDELCACLCLAPGIGRGMLRSLPTRDLVELQDVLSRLPALQDLIRVLGRMKAVENDDAPTVLERIGRAVERVVEVEREVEGERGIEVRGIERSGEIARMLPSEALQLTHPLLRRLWFARLSERTLLTYHAPGVLTQRVSEKQTFEDGAVRADQRPERGPILMILDTSGSMHGYPERIAKAIVLQMLGVAHMSQRPCYVYNFSGPGDLAEIELSLASDGLARLLVFLERSFHGGTHPDEALRRACNKLDTAGWRQADVVVISDGEFVVSPDARARVRRARQTSAARFHGVCAGQGDGFVALDCESLHDVTEWAQPRFFMS